MELLNAHLVKTPPEVNRLEVTELLETLYEHILELQWTQVIQNAITKPLNNNIYHLNTLETKLSEFIKHSNDMYEDLSHRMEIIWNG